MAEVEEPQFNSLQERIAALNQSQNNRHQTFGKRPPPPVPSERPAAPARTQTVNNPPIASYASSDSRPSSTASIGLKGGILPPPVINKNINPRIASTRPIPRTLPPPLPNRGGGGSDSSLALPARRQPPSLAHKGSSSSIGSAVSSLSLNNTRTGSSITSNSSVEPLRKLPPTFEQSKLSVLPPPKILPPPTLRGRAAELQPPANGKVPLVSVKSMPAVPVAGRDAAIPPPRANGPPRLPSRSKDSQPPRLPSRRTESPAPPQQPPRPSRAPAAAEEELPPAMPPRPSRTEPPPSQQPRLLPPPGAGARQPPPLPTNRTLETPGRAVTPPKTTEPEIRELTVNDFKSVVMRGQPTFVEFYSPHCYNCHQSEAAWRQIAADFAHASDKLMIAQWDSFTHMEFNREYSITKFPTLFYFDGHSETPVRYQDGGISNLEDMRKFLQEKTGISPAGAANDAVPAINMSSKPSAAQVKAVQSRPAPALPDTEGCLICRDFSGPDQVAADYPRESLPNGDKIGYLAGVLCRPFRSPTDKARAIFRWLAYNIAYDTAAFFGNNVKHVEPADTVATGLAVCGGYAGLFVAIGQKAGLDCVMVTGHGKGFGYSALKPGDPVPPYKPDGHAWNAVRIDGGEWKLLDACWGAGNVTGGSQVFNKTFTHSYFTMSNDDFGIKHFPRDDAHFFRDDGRTPSWEEYMIGPVGAEPLQIYGSVSSHGLSETSFTPPQKHIPVVGGDDVVRFQFSKICEHWDHERNGTGKPYCMILQINGRGGNKKDFLPFDSNDFWYWLDIDAKDLGVPGDTVTAFAVTTVNGQDARGLTKKEYLQKKGNCATGFGGVSAWELV